MQQCFCQMQASDAALFLFEVFPLRFQKPEFSGMLEKPGICAAFRGVCAVVKSFQNAGNH